MYKVWAFTNKAGESFSIYYNELSFDGVRCNECERIWFYVD